MNVVVSRVTGSGFYGSGGSCIFEGSDDSDENMSSAKNVFLLGGEGWVRGGRPYSVGWQ